MDNQEEKNVFGGSLLVLCLTMYTLMYFTFVAILAYVAGASFFGWQLAMVAIPIGVPYLAGAHGVFNVVKTLTELLFKQ